MLETPKKEIDSEDEVENGGESSWPTTRNGTSIITTTPTVMRPTRTERPKTNQPTFISNKPRGINEN
jgi:hypothetical protein